MLLAEAIEQTRSILQDQQPPFRYTTETLNYALRTCLATIAQRRPDLFIGEYRSGQVELSDADLADASLVLPVAEPWVRRVPFGMAAICELRDDEYASNGRSAGLMQVFMEGLL